MFDPILYLLNSLRPFRNIGPYWSYKST